MRTGPVIPPVSRRAVLAGLGSIPLWSAAFAGSPQASHVTTRKTHAVSLLGDVKYPKDFAHFDYVNPRAPKSGGIRMTAIGGFDSLNPFIVQGSAARGILMLYDTLLKPSLDEAATQYPLIAQEIEYPSDYSSATFTLNPAARFHDGTPITADDVIFSFNLLREKGRPLYRQYYENVSSAKKIDAHTVTFAFNQTGNRELPSIIGQLIYILPRHFWQCRDKAGKARDFARSTLEPPLGSGPYRVAQVEPGRFIEYQRVDDYWARDLPVNIGQNNFDRIRYDFYFDADVALTAFLAGTSDVRLDMSPKSWATRYKVPQVESGRIKRIVIPDENPNGMQGFFFNLRRAKFQDLRVRQALLYAFDFEWVNKHLLYGDRKRLNSYFQNSELAASGLPTAEENELLLPFKAQLPPELFTQEFKCPVSTGNGDNRENLRRAMQLFESAGYVVRDAQLTDKATGQPFTIEFLEDEPGLERIIHAYLRELEKLGVRGAIRVVDPSQYQNRLDSFDFDITTDWQRQNLSPGNEQREMFGTAAADRPGSGNIAGLKHPVVDALIEKIVFAPNRRALISATRALDRVLLWEHLCVPEWYLGGFPCAYWDRFGMPGGTQHLAGLPSTWWFKGAPAAVGST